MGGVQLSAKCVCVIVGGVHERLQSRAYRRRLAITVDKCCDGANMLKLFYFISDVVPC